MRLVPIHLKQELDEKILKRAKIVVNNLGQAVHGGEINVPVSKGTITERDVYANLGEVVVGKKAGRTSIDEITVFDSTGLAIQDIATAWIVFEKAKKEEIGSWISL